MRKGGALLAAIVTESHPVEWFFPVCASQTRPTTRPGGMHRVGSKETQNYSLSLQIKVVEEHTSSLPAFQPLARSSKWDKRIEHLKVHKRDKFTCFEPFLGVWSSFLNAFFNSPLREGPFYL